MAGHDEGLLATAKLLVRRRKGQSGPLPAARVRRSISTAYYALFHFVLDEATRALVGTHHDLRRRRRTLARVFSHAGIRTALAKVGGATVDPSVADILRGRGATGGAVATPPFARDLASVFLDVQSKRQVADYDLNEDLDEANAQLTIARVERAVAAWQNARGAEDRDFKQALCMLMLLKGQIRREGPGS